MILVVGAQHDVVHVAYKAGHRDQGDVHDDEGEEAEHSEEVNGARRLPAAKQLGVPVEAVDGGGRHGDAGEDSQRAGDKHDGEIGDLLQRVIAVESVEFRRQVAGGVVDPCVPCLQQHQSRLGHKPPPLLGVEEHGYQEDAGDNESVNVEEVPASGDANGMPVAGCGDDGGDVAGIVLRGPDPIRRCRERCQTNPLAARRAVIVEIEAGMIGQDGETASYQHGHKKEVEEVAVTHPEREAMRTVKIAGRYLRHGRNVR